MFEILGELKNNIRKMHMKAMSELPPEQRADYERKLDKMISEGSEKVGGNLNYDTMMKDIYNR